MGSSRTRARTHVLNPCPLHWQADSQPLCHQGTPPARILIPVVLGLYINLGTIDTCTMLNIPIHENSTFPHLFVSSFIPLKRNSNIFSTKAKCIFVSGHFIVSFIFQISYFLTGYCSYKGNLFTLKSDFESSHLAELFNKF